MTAEDTTLEQQTEEAPDEGAAVVSEEAPHIPAEDDGAPSVEYAEGQEPIKVNAPVEVLHFAVPMPGFIPAGVKHDAQHVAPATQLRGFIPAQVVDPVTGEVPSGACPHCDADFSDRPNPAASLKAHMRSKHHIG